VAVSDPRHELLQFDLHGLRIGRPVFEGRVVLHDPA
jgi:hypothetical protein